MVGWRRAEASPAHPGRRGKGAEVLLVRPSAPGRPSTDWTRPAQGGRATASFGCAPRPPICSRRSRADAPGSPSSPGHPTAGRLPRATRRRSAQVSGRAQGRQPTFTRAACRLSRTFPRAAWKDPPTPVGRPARRAGVRADTEGVTEQRSGRSRSHDSPLPPIDVSASDSGRAASKCAASARHQDASVLGRLPHPRFLVGSWAACAQLLANRMRDDGLPATAP